MTSTWYFAALVMLAACHWPAAIEAQAPTLTLEEAVSLAQANSPDIALSRSTLRRSETAVRGAYGALLPQISSSFGLQYREGRPDLVQGVSFGAASDVLSSSASASVGMTFSLGSLAATRQARSDLAAAEADVSQVRSTVRNNVSQAYLTAIQARAQLALQDSIVASADEQLRFTQARYSVGAGTLLDVRSSEANFARARVARLRQAHSAREQVLRLFETIGVDAPDSVVLSNNFELFVPAFPLDSLVNLARTHHPELESFRSRERAASQNVSRARSQWFPTIQIGTSLSGYASHKTDINPDISAAEASTFARRADCYTTDSLRRGAGMPSNLAKCDAIVFTDTHADAIRAANSEYPFGMSRSPVTYSASVSLPIFNGFSRENTIAVAEASRADSRVQYVQAERRLKNQISINLGQLTTQYEAARQLEAASDASREAVALAQERYRIGTGNLLELSSAKTTFEQASADFVNGVFEFQRILAQLEFAVGRRLR